MTREEAIAAARDFVIRSGRSVILEPEDVRPMQAARFNALFGRVVYPCDFWVVDFRKVLPPGIAAESPGAVTVEVNPATGEVRDVYVGMERDWGGPAEPGAAANGTSPSHKVP